jgi:hypothetical protein
MCNAVYLDRELGSSAVEVEHVRTDRVLPTNADGFRADTAPQENLGQRKRSP